MCSQALSHIFLQHFVYNVYYHIFCLRNGVCLSVCLPSLLLRIFCPSFAMRGRLIFAGFAKQELNETKSK